MCRDAYKKTKKDITLSWLLLFLLQCTVSNYCFYKLSLAISYIGTRFFYPSRQAWHIITTQSCISLPHECGVSHRTEGMYFCRLDDIQNLSFDDMQFLRNWWYTMLRIDLRNLILLTFYDILLARGEFYEQCFIWSYI